MAGKTEAWKGSLQLWTLIGRNAEPRCQPSQFGCRVCALNYARHGQDTHTHTHTHTQKQVDLRLCACYCWSRVQLFVTPWTVACQALLSRQRYWSGTKRQISSRTPNPILMFNAGMSDLRQQSAFLYELPLFAVG